MYVIGANVQDSLSTDELDKMKEYCHSELQVDYDKEMSAVTLHSRAIVNGTMYHSTLYNCKATKRNNYTVAYQMDEQVQFGTVKSFLSLTIASKTSPVILCAIKPLRPHQSRAATTISSMEVNAYLLKTFKCVSEKDEFIYIEAERLISLCVSITVQEKQLQCVVLPPNGYEFIN